MGIQENHRDKRGESMSDRCRYIAITDINRGPEIDDIQSMIRLLLYSNEIDIEGLIACSSCFLKKPNMARNTTILHRLIDGYGAVRSNLLCHADGWPDTAYLHSIVSDGIPVFGQGEGDGFAEPRWKDNAGVQAILSSLQRGDPRPLWIGLWGGANTLAQALWTAEQTMKAETFTDCLQKLRIYSISDQDHAGPWIRARYGDRLFYIVSPSRCDCDGAADYYRATWPGISADRFAHGSEDGVNRTNGFTGARRDLVSNRWLRRNIRIGSFGRMYPRTKYIMEGDTPSFLGLIPNGLNLSEQPELGCWGGRYERRQPQGEPFPIYTNARDTVTGMGGKPHCSPQATIWRWREDFQNDFAARMQWTLTSDYTAANHPPIIEAEQDTFIVHPGDTVRLHVTAHDPSGVPCTLTWFVYPEAGRDFSYRVPLAVIDRGTVALTVPPSVEAESELQIILRAANAGSPFHVRYCRISVRVISG